MILLPTGDPKRLLRNIKQAIDENAIRTWSYDIEGDFNHTPDQWAGQGWLRPSVEAQELRFYVVPRAGTHMSSLVYAVLHGRFIEMILQHFDQELMGRAQASPLPEGRDEIS